VLEQGEPVVHTTELSYFSRLSTAEEFGRLSTVETHRRGVERAKQVCAVLDGAVWEQGYVDLQRKDAVRILWHIPDGCAIEGDFPHAGEYLTQAGQVVHGEGTPEFQAWLTDTLHELKQGSPDVVLERLGTLQQEATARGLVNAALIADSLQYLEKRRAQIAYAEFQVQGFPIGSGAVESGNGSRPSFRTSWWWKRG
jgi:hypothetical protein